MSQTGFIIPPVTLDGLTGDAPLSELLDLAGAFAHHVLIKQQRPELMSSYVLVGPRGAEVIGCPWRNEQEKLASVDAIKNRAAMLGATKLSFVGEVWVTEKEGPGPHLAPSRDPKRKECVIAYATDGSKTEHSSWRIVRNAKGKVTALVREMPVEGIIYHHNRLVDGILPFG